MHFAGQVKRFALNVTTPWPKSSLGNMVYFSIIHYLAYAAKVKHYKCNIANNPCA